MCGFLWFTSRNDELLQKLSLPLKSRAVDREYYFSKEDFSFYHAHLAISDLDKNTSQPLFCDNIVIGLVGEIYNKQKLLDLCEPGLYAQDFTELEVIHKIYKKMWKKFVNFVNGEFAICVFDKNIQKTFLFRDRWGTNNIYFRQKEGILYFASEMKALILDEPKPNKKAFIQYMTFQFCISPNTLLQDIFCLRPGTILEFSHGKISFEPFDAFLPQNHFVNIIDALEYAVKSRIPYFQERIFVSLSGGPDSNLILFFLKKYFPHEIIAYSFQTHKNAEEIAIAKRNTERLKIKHLVIDMDKISHFSQSDIFEHEWLVQLPNLWKILKQQFPQYQNIKVEFGWDGKEELILSNSHFPYQKIFAYYKYFRSKNLIDEFHITQEFLNKEMFDFNLQMIDKITLRNGLERRLPFTDYELLPFYKMKNYREQAKKFLHENNLEIVNWEFGYNLGIDFSYLETDYSLFLQKFINELKTKCSL